MHSNARKFNREEAQALVGTKLAARMIKEVPLDSPGEIVGVIEKSRGFNLRAVFRYQRMTFGLSPHEHEITRWQFERCRSAASR